MKPKEKESITFRVNPDEKHDLTKFACDEGMSTSKYAERGMRYINTLPVDKRREIMNEQIEIEKGEQPEQQDDLTNEQNQGLLLLPDTNNKNPDVSEEVKKLEQKYLEKIDKLQDENQMLKEKGESGSKDEGKIDKLLREAEKTRIDKLQDEIQMLKEKSESGSKDGGKIDKLLKEAERTRNDNINYIINDRIEKIEKKAEQDKVKAVEKAVQDKEEKIKAESIVISTHPELLQVFNIFVKHCKDKGRYKDGKQMVQNYLHNQWVWGRTPDFENELWKKAMNGRRD